MSTREESRRAAHESERPCGLLMIGRGARARAAIGRLLTRVTAGARGDGDRLLRRDLDAVTLRWVAADAVDAVDASCQARPGVTRVRPTAGRMDQCVAFGSNCVLMRFGPGSPG